jgi:Hint module
MVVLKAVNNVLIFTYILIIPIQDSYDLWVRVMDEASATWKETGVVFPVTPPAPALTPKPETECVVTTQELRKAVNNCYNGMNETLCLINICNNRLLMPAASISSKGIDLSNKNIYLRCDQECAPKRCILDGSSITRLFYGSNTNITFLNFIFANGFHPDSGGAIKLENNSIVTMINCSFVNNSAPSGSAVQVNNSQLIVSGIETSLINNTGISPPLEVLSSYMNISHAVFAGNQVLEYLADILLFNSNTTMYDVHFLNSTMVPFKECHVYIAMLADDYANQSSCMNVDPSNKSIPVVDLSEYCPSSPTVSPVPSPRPVICFSGQNFIQIQHIGYVPMHRLRIGDYVKSSENEYTQVYGFGHFDPNQDGTFLQITFHDDASSEPMSIIPYQESSSSFIEISLQHLTMVERNHQQYQIPAGDVRVDDILSGRRVKSIQEVIFRGVYAPLTQSGDIRINGILASNYVNLFDLPSMRLLIDQHILAHILLFPQRMFCCFFLELCKKEIYIHGYGPLTYLLVGGSSFINNMMSDAIDPMSLIWFFNVLLGMSITVLVVRRR